jgi:drug/metabolite transporter (DMT)-like permease
MHPGRNDYLLLILLGAVWGFSFLLIKLAVATIPPLTVAAGRICLGAALLLLVAIARDAPLRQLRASWLPLLAMGALGTVPPFFLIGWGETRIDSGLAAILMSATPLYTIILAHFLVAGEPLTVGKVAGVALGFAGMLVLVGPSALTGLGGVLVAQLAVAGAPLCYAGNSIVARRLPAMPAELVGAGMLLAAALIGLPASLIIDRPWQLAPSTLSLLAVVGLGVVCTAFGYLLLFRIIAGGRGRLLLLQQLSGAAVRPLVGRAAAGRTAGAAGLDRAAADLRRHRRAAAVAGPGTPHPRGRQPRQELIASVREAEDVRHRIEARRLAMGPQRSAQGAAREDLAAGGDVRDLDALAIAGEDDTMIANDIAAAQHGKADVAALARPGDTVARPLGGMIEIDAAPLGRRAAQRQRRAGGRIDLGAMMHLDDLDIPVGIEGTRDLPHQLQEERDAEAHVRCQHDGGLLRRPAEGRDLRRLQAGGADDVDLVPARRQLGMLHGGGRIRELEHRIGRAEQLRRIIADGDAQGIDAGDETDILADDGSPGALAAADYEAAIAGGGGPHQHLPHPAGATDDADLERSRLGRRCLDLRSRPSHGCRPCEPRSRPFRPRPLHDAYLTPCRATSQPKGQPAGQPARAINGDSHRG